MIELSNGARFNFVQNKYKQKILIGILLNYTELNLLKIAHILKVPFERLEKVIEQKDFLTRAEVIGLGELFLLCFSAPGRDII
jgi:hypothetical protein